MSNLDLMLICEPLDIGTKSYEEFLQKEIGTFFPLASITSYSVGDTPELRETVHYLVANRPFLTSVRFANFQGGEPAFKKITPYHETRDNKIWSVIKKWWPILINRLKGPLNCCYLSGFNLLKRDIHNFLPDDFDGKILTRGNHPDIPVLIECTDRFIAQSLTYGDFWWYGSWVYILGKTEEQTFTEWTQTYECTNKFVKDFFQKIEAVFWVKYELEGIWILSHKLNTEKICKILDIEGVNKEISQLQ